MSFDKARDEWLSDRTHIIGASDSPAILGVGYAGHNALSVWWDKTHGPIFNRSEVENKSFLRGLAMEPALREIFEIETGIECLATPEKYHIERHRSIPYVGCTLDGRTNETDRRRPVELKNLGSYNSDEWAEGHTPLKYLVQMQHQLCVTESDYGYLLALFGFNEPVVRKIERNDAFIASMLNRLETFWEYVTSDQRPPVDDSEATAKILRKLHPKDNGLAVQLPEDFVVLVNDYDRISQAIKDLERGKRYTTNAIKAAIGDNTYGVLGRHYFSWKTSERKGYTVDPTTTRTLRKIKSLPPVKFLPPPPLELGDCDAEYSTSEEAE